MKIQCDRCDRIYNASEDTIVASAEEKDYHLCPLCRILIKDFIEQKIPLKFKGNHQKEKEETAKVYEDYYKVMEVVK